ncbi:MAG TPA: DUF1566 domain-containing protein [Gammaproteobacteria bacterium]|nr:DUF1566 domain-containing protein [Gammaproteobacteria bacterium]
MQHKTRYTAWLIAAHVLALPGGAQGAQTCDTTITPTSPDSRFNAALRDGTVIDKITGLTWKKCSEGQTYNVDANTCSGNAVPYTWPKALQRAREVNQGGAGKTGGYAGYTDWRVPNIKELRSLVEQACRDPAINPHKTIFPLSPSALYWSSSPFARTVGEAWGVDFTSGEATFESMANPGFVRLVRGGL